jgi:hypothetical protein
VPEADGKGVWSWRPDAGVKLAEAIPPATVAKEPGHRGEHVYKPLKPLRREMPGVSGEPVVTTLVRYFTFAREAAGALGTRLSLRPLISQGQEFQAKLARIARRDRELVFEASLRGAKRRRSNPFFFAAKWIASLRSQ